MASWYCKYVHLLTNTVIGFPLKKDRWPQLSRSLTSWLRHLWQPRALAYCNAKSRPCLNSASRPGRAARPRSPAFTSPATAQHDSVKVEVCDGTAVRPSRHTADTQQTLASGLLAVHQVLRSSLSTQGELVASLSTWFQRYIFGHVFVAALLLHIWLVGHHAIF